MIETRILPRGLLLAVALAACLPGSSPGQSERYARQPQPEPALRLTFEYRDGELTLVKVEELAMVLPVAVRERVLEAGATPGGYALELQGPETEALLTREFDDPLTLVSERPDPEDPSRVQREVTRLESATFSVLVPAPAEARLVLVTRPAPGQEALPEAEQQREALGAFDLETHRSREDG
jgi:hypothetical protein